MNARSVRMRKVADLGVKIVSVTAAVIGIIFLVWIIFEVLKRGALAINLDFFTKPTSPPGTEGGGVANAIVGTIYMTVIATIIGVPIGMLAGVYLSEYGMHNRFGRFANFATNVLMGIPSILVGLFVYTILVLPVGHFSGYAGAVALAIIMLPVVGRTTQDMLNLVPNSLREAALALGSPRWKTTLNIVFRSAKTGLITGGLLGIARVSGETAPLLFTSLNSPFWPESLNHPTANLTVTIFNFAMSPYKSWQATAWGASLVIMASVLIVTVFARIIFKRG